MKCECDLLRLAVFMNLLGLLLYDPHCDRFRKHSLVPGIHRNRFAVLFNYVPLTITDCTNHFSSAESTTYGAIKKLLYRSWPIRPRRFRLMTANPTMLIRHKMKNFRWVLTVMPWSIRIGFL